MEDKSKQLQLSEVWGETVALRNLGLALSISVPATLATFLVARWLLESNMADAARADTLSLLVGLSMVILSAVLCARLFKPQRIVTTDAAEQSSVFEETIGDLADEAGGLGSIADLPPEVQNEMRDLGLYDAFSAAEQKSKFEHARSGKES